MSPPDGNTILMAVLIGLSSWTLRELVGLGKKVARLEQEVLNGHGEDRRHREKQQKEDNDEET